MKALSIRQPWAWLIVHGHKPVENRTWATPYRGEVLIHAGKVFDAEGLASVHSAFPQLRALLPQQYDLGGIVGVATITACVQAHPSAWFTGPHGFVMADARPLPFVPLRGELGFFHAPDDHTRLQAALGSATQQQAEAEAAGQAPLF